MLNGSKLVMGVLIFETLYINYINYIDNEKNCKRSRSFITARKRSLGQGNIFTPVCHSVHRGRAWLLLGGVRGCSGGGA